MAKRSRDAFTRLSMYLIDHHTEIVFSTPVGAMLRELSTALLNDRRDDLALVDEFSMNFNRQVSRADANERALVRGSPN